MRRSTFAPFAAALAVSAPLAAQPPQPPQPPPSPRSPAALIAAERAFARMSVDAGIHAAFVANLDRTGVVFTPRAVNAQRWYAANPPRGPEATLFWTPAHVGLSASGDLGFSTGPYRFAGVRGGDTVRTGGYFASVWGRRPGEPWRVLVDLGIRDSVTRVVDSTGTPSVGRAGDAATTSGAANALAAKSAVLRADSALGVHYAHAAADDGLASRAADDVWLLRERAGLRVGRAAARMLGEQAGAGYASAPIDGAVARSGDLGYTYGTYVRDAGAADPAGREAGNYLRVWRRQDGRWRLVLDVASPVPNG